MDANNQQQQQYRADLQDLLDTWAQGLPPLSMALHIKLIRVADDDTFEELLQCSLFSTGRDSTAG